MPRILRFMLMVVLSMAPLTAIQAASPSPEQASALAERLLDQLEAGEFEAATASFDDALKAALNVEKLREVQQQLNTAGPIKQRDRPKVSSKDGLLVAVIRIRREAATLDMTVAIDANGKIAGLHFLPATQPAAKTVPADGAFTEMGVTVGEGQTALPGTLTLPAQYPGTQKRGFPAIVLVHGSGPQDRDETVGDSRPFFDLAHGLARSGIAVLRYDKRTKAQPESFIGKSFSIDDEITDDAVGAVRFLQDNKHIDRKRVFVLGHSLGGMVAPRIAKRAGAVAGVILFAAPARSVLALLSEQARQSFLQDGTLSDEDQRALQEIQQFAAQLGTENATPSSVQTSFLGSPAEYWRSVHAVDAVADAKSLTCGILILQGGRDRQVTEQEFRLWKSGLTDKKDVAYLYYPSLNHLGIAESTLLSSSSRPLAGHVDSGLIRDVAQWLSASPKYSAEAC